MQKQNRERAVGNAIHFSSKVKVNYQNKAMEGEILRQIFGLDEYVRNDR